MTVKMPVGKWGDSKAIRLQADLLNSLGWQNAQSLLAEKTNDNRLVLSLASDKDDGSLAYLFKDYRDDGLREKPLDFDESVGEELW
ncbi:MAG: hypothetical protein LBI41_01975 [Lactobacillales bacterium]|jgi:antitoxin component of MazEF toxin-antitoxin module|nr:hypothetical protein [Lactobacillales bacterium]